MKKAMKKIVQMTFVAALGMTLGAGVGFAKKAPTVKNRQINEQKRIHTGAKSGALTVPETVRLEKNAARIHRGVVHDRRDGGAFTPRERIKSQHRLNRQSRAIHRQKTDGQTR